MANRFPRQTYNGGFIGYGVRRSLGADTTFRVRRGNGHYGAILGHRYQDKFALVIPGSINNPESDPFRAQFRAAVAYWQDNIFDADRRAYNRRAGRGLKMSGYNLFMREAMLGKVQMFIDRGDPAVYDFDKNDLIKDGAWHDLDLSSLVTTGAKAVFIVGHVEGNGIDWTIMFRKKGNTSEVNHGGMETIRANVERHRSSIVALGTSRVIQYKADNQAWATLDLSIRGWWT